MTLFLTSNSNYDSYFIQWLVKHIKINICASISLEKFSPLVKFINLEMVSNELSIYEVIRYYRLALNQIIAVKLKDGWEIVFNPIGNIPNEELTLKQLCSFIETGCLQIRGLHIITSVFEDIKNNIVKYFNDYISEVT